MEEKERYTITSFEIEEPSVIFDNKTQQIILTLVDYNYDEITSLEYLLNQQDKQIKELEQENKELNDYLETDEVTKREYYQKVDKIDKAKDREIKKLKDKIKELEDYTENTAKLIDKLTEDSVFASKQLAIEKLEKIKEKFTSEKWDLYDTPDLLEQVCELRNNQIKYIDKQIKQLKEGIKNE